MDIAIVTGASSNIGIRIAQKLVGMGFKVFGLDQSFSKCSYFHRDFKTIECDLTSTEQIKKAFDYIEEDTGKVFALINAAQHTTVNPLESTEIEEIEYAMATGLIGPLILTKLVLPNIMKFHGYIINICWNGRHPAPNGAVSAAAQGGLYHLGQSLFNELRDTGAKICNVYPEENFSETNKKQLLDNAPQSAIDASLVATAVENIMRMRENNLVSEIVIRPQGTREEPRIPAAVAPLIRASHDVQLPSRENFPQEPDPIPTPERQRPLDAPPPEEEDEEEEDDELDLLIQQSKEFLVRKNQQRQKHKEQDRERSQDGNQNRNSHNRNRRGGRNRRNRKESSETKGENISETNTQEADENQPQNDGSGNEHSQNPNQNRNSRNRNRNRNRRNRKFRDSQKPQERKESGNTQPANENISNESRSAQQSKPSDAPASQKAPRSSNVETAPKPETKLTESITPKKKTAKKRPAKKKTVVKAESITESKAEKTPAKKAAKKKAAKKKTAKKKTAKKKVAAKAESED